MQGNVVNLVWCPRLTTSSHKILHCGIENLNLQILIADEPTDWPYDQIKLIL